MTKIKQTFISSLSKTVNEDEKNKTDKDDSNFATLQKCVEGLSLSIKDEEKESEMENARPQIDCEVLIRRVEYDGVIVKVIPPTEPATKKNRGPVEIVLLIDVSSSMHTLAPVPPSGEGGQSEQKGFTVLDLTKHAACTIAEGLNEYDTLCIVTFSTNHSVLLPCLPMNAKNKEVAKKKILSMRADGCTHLWSGMKAALDQFSGELGMVAALMVLTDGQPNERLSNGFIPAMRRWCKSKRLERIPVPVHTFGFGYDLQKGLLQSIAEFGRGDYSFIPDASMLGTVFNHAVANLQSTYAQEAMLTLAYPKILELCELGDYINKADPKRSLLGPDEEYSIDLRTIQYGQPRDFFLPFKWHPDVRAEALRNTNQLTSIRASLKYRQLQITKSAFAEIHLSGNGSTLSPAETAFHISRAKTIEFLSQLFPLTERGEHHPLLIERVPTYDDLQQVVTLLPANKFLDSPLNLNLIKDWIGSANKKGEVELALQKDAETRGFKSNWERWGCHYLPSLMMAHRSQKCLSFKDPGTQSYGKSSQTFCSQLEILDDLFDSLPAPPPSKLYACKSSSRDGVSGHSSPPSSNMSRYRNVDSSCFAGHTKVLTVNPTDGSEGKLPIEQLRTGDIVKVASGKKKLVRTVLKCYTNPSKGRTLMMIPVSNSTSLWVTPWHPVSRDGGRTWIFPAEAYPEDKYPERMKLGFMEPVYAVQLSRQADDVANDHAINVEGLWGATMGHGLTTKNAPNGRDIRIHDFYGDWATVAKSLDMLPEYNGLVLSKGATKDGKTGRSNGFLPFQGIESPSHQVQGKMQSKTTLACNSIAHLRNRRSTFDPITGIETNPEVISVPVTITVSAEKLGNAMSSFGTASLFGEEASTSEDSTGGATTVSATAGSGLSTLELSMTGAASPTLSDNGVSSPLQEKSALFGAALAFIIAMV